MRTWRNCPCTLPLPVSGSQVRSSRFFFRFHSISLGGKPFCMISALSGPTGWEVWTSVPLAPW